MSNKDPLTELLEDGRTKFVFINENTKEEREAWIGVPTAEHLRQAEWENAKAYNRALREGILTRSEMIDILKSRNIIGDQYEAQAQKLQEELFNLLLRLETETDTDLKTQIAVEVREKREDIFQWNQRANGPLGSTCENMANDSRTSYLTSCIIQKKDGSRMWETYDEYRGPGDQEFKFRALFEVMMWMEGVDPNFLENAPEAKILSESLAAAQREAARIAEETLKDIEALKIPESTELVEETKAEVEEVEKAIPAFTKKASTRAPRKASKRKDLK